jgi:hypothetical protein
VVEGGNLFGMVGGVTISFLPHFFFGWPLMLVSFTRISDDILVPTQYYGAKDDIPLNMPKWFWWGLGGFWLFIAIGMKFDMVALGIGTLFMLILLFLFVMLMKLPFGWIELNRKEGTVTVWTSAKKRRRVAKGKFSYYRIDWTCRRVVTSRYSAEYRYSLGLYPAKGEKKYKKAFLDGKHEVQFCFLYDMETHNSKVPPDNSLEEKAEQVTRKAEVFLNDFFSGKQLPNRKDNTYSFSA